MGSYRYRRRSKYLTLPSKDTNQYLILEQMLSTPGQGRSLMTPLISALQLGFPDFQIVNSSWKLEFHFQLIKQRARRRYDKQSKSLMRR